MAFPQGFVRNINQVNFNQRGSYVSVTIDGVSGYLRNNNPYFNTPEYIQSQLAQGNDPDGFVSSLGQVNYNQRGSYAQVNIAGRTGFLPRTSGYFQIPQATLNTIYSQGQETSSTSDDAIVDETGPIEADISGIPPLGDEDPPLGPLLDIGDIGNAIVSEPDSTGYREVYSPGIPRENVLVYLDVLGDSDASQTGYFNGSPFTIEQARNLDTNPVNDILFPESEGWVKVEIGGLEQSHVGGNTRSINRNIARVLNDPIARELLQENHPTHWSGAYGAPQGHIAGTQLVLPTHFYDFARGHRGQAVGPFFQESAGTNLAGFDAAAGDLDQQINFLGDRTGSVALSGILDDPRALSTGINPNNIPAQHLNHVQHVVYYTRQAERQFLGYVNQPEVVPTNPPDTTQPINSDVNARGGYLPEVIFFGGDVRGATARATVSDAGTITDIQVDDVGGSIQSGRTTTATASSLEPPKITLSTPDLSTGWFAGRDLVPQLAVSDTDIKSVYDDKNISITEDQLNSLIASRCGYFDPLAQTFLVPETNQSLGIFISSIDVCFSSAPNSSVLRQNPSSVVMEIRPCTAGAGTPSRDYVLDASGRPARAEVDGENIRVTDGISTLPSFDDAATFTKFRFPVPVYIEPNRKYAFVLMANNSEFKVWINDINSPLIGDGVLEGTVSDSMVTTTVGGRKNHGGKLFKAHSGSQTWEEDENSDMMFRINRCNFTSTTGQADISVGQDIGAAINYSSVYFNPNYGSGVFTPSPRHATVEYTQYQTVTAGGSSLAAIDDFSANRDTTMPSAMQLRANQNNGDFRVTTKLSRPTSTSAISPVINIEDWQCLFNDYSINDGAIVDDMIEIVGGGSGYAVNNTFNVGGGVGAAAIIKVTAVGAGGVITAMEVTSGGSGFSGAATVTEGTVNGSGATIRILGEEGADTGGNATFRYISKKISLSSGMDASDLRAFVTAKVPIDTSVFVYYRVLSANDGESLDQKSFRKMRQVNPTLDAKFSDFREIEFDSGGDDQITYVDSGGSSYSDFSTFQIKIVGYSSSTVKIPSFRDVRAIAVT